MVFMIHETAEVHPTAHIGPGTRIWHQAQVREEARIGGECIISKGVYIDHQAALGREQLKRLSEVVARRR